MIALKNQSLRSRLVISAALLLVVFLGVMGIGLNNAFKQNVLSNAEDSLRNQVILLLANVDVFDNKLSVSNELLEARLAQADSDLFAQISTEQGVIVWNSASSLGNQMPLLDGSLGEFRFHPNFIWPAQSNMYGMSLNVEWETEQGDMPFTIQVAEKTTAYDKRLQAYRKQIIIWLAVLGSSLLALLLALFTWALRPLVRVTQQVAEIEQGTRESFDEDYPDEVSQLTQNLNQLLNHEEQRINHQKEVLGNLAHSLKTPLAVLKGIKYNHTNNDDVQHQLDSIQNIIDYQLQSASAVGRRRFGQAILVKQVTQKILNSLDKIYLNKSLNVIVDIQDDVQFFGDQGDWMELCGNVLENAYKWAQSELTIKIENRASKQQSNRKATLLEISDDGPGIDHDRKKIILQRGVRLDSQTPGHGLGLNIVKGIVDAYQGELRIEANQPLGTVFKIKLN